MIALANKYIEKRKTVDALILACTELPLAIKPEDVNVPIVNTTQVHINAIYQYAIRSKIAKPAEPVNGQDERRISCAAVDSPARLC